MQWKIILLLILIPACANAGWSDWSKQDKERQFAYTILHIIDWGQTKYIAKHPAEYCESWNLILPEHPSTQQVNLYFATTLIGHWLVTNWLEDKVRKYWQIGTIGLEAVCVGNNLSLGIKMRFQNGNMAYNYRLFVDRHNCMVRMGLVDHKAGRVAGPEGC